jgi:hypothetical protein
VQAYIKEQQLFEADFEEKAKTGKPQNKRMQNYIKHAGAAEVIRGMRCLESQIEDLPHHFALSPPVILDQLPEDKQAAVLPDVLGALFFGIAANSSYTGIEPHGMGCAKYQIAGSRLLVVVNPHEAMAKCKLPSLKATRDWLQRLTAKQVEEAKLRSVSVAEVSQCDTVYIPYGHMFAERTLQINNIGIRVPIFCMDPRGFDGWMTLHDNLVKTLRCISKTKNCCLLHK